MAAAEHITNLKFRLSLKRCFAEPEPQQPEILKEGFAVHDRMQAVD